MHARVPVKAKLSKREREIIMAYVDDEIARLRVNWTRRIFKLMALALRDPLSEKGHGMGATQINKVITRINDYAAQDGEEFWTRVDRAVIDQLGMRMERENERSSD